MKKNKFMEIINKNIKESENLLKESLSFYEEEDYDTMEPENDENYEIETEPETKSFKKNISSHIDNIRKYALNGLSELCDNPESEEYQMLKKIFQMCDKKPEKNNQITESYRLFGVNKENNKILFETKIVNQNDLKTLKKNIISEAIERGYNPSNIKLVSENKIIL